jgi:hypothetical protein
MAKKQHAPEAPPERVQHLIVSIYDLVPHEDNYNQHPQEQLDGLQLSLKMFGQVEDTVVKSLPDGKYKIVAHEGVTTAALQLLGKGECSYLEQWGIIVVPDSWDAVKIRAYMVASNLHAKLSVPDDTKLANLLQEQLDAGQSLVALGSSEEELNALLEAEAEKLLKEKQPEEGDAEVEQMPEQWAIIVECSDEHQQVSLLERFESEGLTCRALVL